MNHYIDQTNERIASESYSEIDNLTFLDLCIVLGTIRDVHKNEIIQALRITESGYQGIMSQPHMRRWKFIKAIIDA